MTLKERIKAQGRNEEAMRETIERMKQNSSKKIVKELKSGQYIVNLYETDKPSHGGGIGVDLDAEIKDKNGESYPMFSGQVRGTGRNGDDFRHWYRTIEKIEEKDDKIYVTVTSNLLKDTYEFDPASGHSRLYGSIDLEKLEKEKNVEKLIDSAADEISLEEKIRNFGNAVVEKHKKTGTRDPSMKITLDDEKTLGVVLVGLYSPGYDPAMRTVKIMAVKDNQFTELEPIDIAQYVTSRPKFSRTVFRSDDVEISGSNVRITGSVLQYDSSGSGRGPNNLGNIDLERTIGDNYKKLEEL